MTIIERILETAEQKGIKQADIAKLIDKGTAQITSWKKRGCNPPAEYIPAIAELLNVSVEWLMTGTEKEESILSDDEKELLCNYRKLEQRDKKEVKAIINFKLEQSKPEGIILNSKTG